MAIKFSYGKKFRVKEELAGQRRKCPASGVGFEIPVMSVVTTDGTRPPPVPLTGNSTWRSRDSEAEEALVIPGLQASPDDDYVDADMYRAPTPTIPPL